MAQAAKAQTVRDSAALYRRIESKLGVSPLRSDKDLARLVHGRVPLTAVASLMRHGLSDDEVYRYIVPRRTLAHRKSRHEGLSQEESDRAVRMARTTALAEEIFGDEARASSWMHKSKVRFDGQDPLAMLGTEAGSRLMEEMLLQLEHGFVA